MRATRERRSSKASAAPALAALLALTAIAPGEAIKINIAFDDVERALVIARSTEAERARFHSPYIKSINTPFVERAEVVSEFRRVVLLAEERGRQGDRHFAYSITRASEALSAWRRRVSVIARVRFHPQNNYVTVPPVTISLVGNENALIGVLRDPVLALPGKPGESVPVLGAVVEGVFEAEALGQREREFVVSLDGKELGRVVFDLGALE